MVEKTVSELNQENKLRQKRTVVGLKKILILANKPVYYNNIFDKYKKIKKSGDKDE